MVKALISIIALVLIGISHAQAGIFNAQTTTLENGLQVVVVPNTRAPIVHHMLWYKAGSAQEINGYSGVAHFLEHLLFKGTDHPDRPLAPGEFSTRIKKLGGQNNAFTSKDYTAFYQTVSKQHLETVMQMEADRIRHAMPPQEHVLSEREVVIEERKQRTDNNPQARFFEQMQAALFPGPPYGRPIIGWDEEITKMDHDHTKAFYDSWYYPNNAVLIIAGDVTLNEILPSVQRIYGAVPKGPETKRHFPVIPAFEGETRVTHYDDQVNQTLWMRGIRAPSYRQNKTDSLALQVLENILDGGATTRLYKQLVVEKKLAVNVSFSYGADQYGKSTIWLSATPAPGIDVDTVEDQIEQLINDVIETGVTDTELTESKKRMQNAAILARDSLSGPAQIIGRALTTGSTLQDVETWDEQIQGVTKEQIQNVANQYLKMPPHEKYHYVTGVLYPQEDKQQHKGEGEQE